MPEMNSVARWMIFLGLGIAFLGLLIFVLGRAGIPLGKLPGDFKYQTGSFSCFIPLASSILISLLLTLILNFIARLSR
jgi:hypothetical protein